VGLPAILVRLAGATALTAIVLGCATTGSPRIVNLEPFLRGQLAPAAAARLEHPEAFRLQVLISHVETVGGRPSRLVRSAYRLGAEYFYPGSAIKLAAAVAALQTIAGLGASHGPIDLLEVPLRIAPLFDGDPPQEDDPTNRDHARITVGHEIRKLSLVSDNQAFNRLYDLVGYDGLNRAMERLGLSSAVITHRLSETRTIPDPSASAAVTFLPPGRASIAVPARASATTRSNRGPGLRVGTAFIRGTEFVAEPMDFTRRNGMSLIDLQNLLVKLVRPDIDVGGPPLVLGEVHRAMLIGALTRYPRESPNPTYSADIFPDDVAKFLLAGVRRVFPSSRPGERIEITGKIGQAFGFTVENSYVHNPANGRAVFVSAVIYTNDDGVLNDDRYEYDTIARPFMADLGELVARAWLR
jgi:Beta-lactamase enzyme family